MSHLRLQELAEMKKKLEKCQDCPLHSRAGKVVPGLGSIDADVLILGEGPGETEAQKGKPFVGRSGKLLQQLLRKQGIKMRQIYVTNVVKHRPPNNRKPKEEESYICGRNYLAQEIELVRPRVILCLGRTASEALHLIEEQRLPRGSLRGYRWMYKDIPAIATWHPAYVLRQEERLPELEQDIADAFAQAAVPDPDIPF